MVYWHHWNSQHKDNLQLFFKVSPLISISVQRPKCPVLQLGKPSLNCYMFYNYQTSSVILSPCILCICISNQIFYTFYCASNFLQHEKIQLSMRIPNRNEWILFGKRLYTYWSTGWTQKTLYQGHANKLDIRLAYVNHLRVP